jgi:hypothetical protein
MDIIDYVAGNDNILKTLAKDSCLQIVRLKRLLANPELPVRYMTAKRLEHASNGSITLDALEKRGPLRGKETFSGPLGKKIAEAGSYGPTIPMRLAAYGIPSDHMTEILLRGRVPRRQYMSIYIEAFSPHLTEEDFIEHAKWRSGIRPVQK